MQTTTLCTSSVFSTTTMSSPCTPVKPSSAIALVPSANRRALYSGSTQARATTLAPFAANLGLVSFDNGVDRVGVDQLLFHQQ